MSVDGVLLSAVKHDLTNKIIGARIDKVYQINKSLMKINLRQTGENLAMAVSISANGARVHLTELNYENPPYPPDFCMLLRKYLTNGYIQEIRQPDYERLLEIDIEKRGEKFTLILEIMGRYSNVILIDEQKNVLDAMHRITEKVSSERQLYPGSKYKYPPAQDKINPLVVNKDNFFRYIPLNFADDSFRAIMYNFQGIGPYTAKEIVDRAKIDPKANYDELEQAEKNNLRDSFVRLFQKVSEGDFTPSMGIDEDGEITYISPFPLQHRSPEKTINYSSTGPMLDYYYIHEIKTKVLRKEKNELLSVVNKYLGKNNKKQKKLRAKLKDSQQAEKYKKKGEIITANIYQLKRGMKKAILPDYYNEGKELKITLDPKLSPSDNAQKYYKKYSKAKKSVAHLKREIRKLRHEERYLDQVKLNLSQAETTEDLSEIREELNDEGYLKKKQRKNKKGRKGKTKALPPYKFISSDDYQILVGRNNRQNDRLTKKIANQADIWLHTKEIAGSHVIIRRDTDQPVPDSTLKEAATLAAYFSNARESTNVPVDFTEVANVNKPKGAKPGLVYYDEYQTIYIDPDAELIKSLRR